MLLQDGRVSSKMAAARLAGAGGARDVVVRSAATDVLEQGLRRQHFEVAPAGDDGLRVADASIAAVAEVARAVGAPVDELRRVDVDLDRTAGRLTSPAGRPDPAPEAPDPRVGEELRELDGRLGERIDAAEPPPWIVVRGAALPPLERHHGWKEIFAPEIVKASHRNPRQEHDSSQKGIELLPHAAGQRMSVHPCGLW